MTHERARFTISQGSTFEAAIGYSRAVVDGDWVFVSGTTGFDYSTMTIADDVESQCAQALRNIADALKQAGSSPDHVVRVTYLIPNPADFEPCWPQLKAFFGTAAPAATAMVVGLVDPRMRIEIEVTASTRGQTPS
ncbi:MAG TPA: RidA family protein [Ilumatobacter sp.]|nr:RidA family protein [Ilumatobacter sp.]